MILESFQIAAKHDSKVLHARYRQNKLTIVDTGWEKHAVMIALYKGYLVYCNRGESLIPTTLSVYKIADRSKVTLDYIAKLNDNNTLSMKEVLNLILGKNSIIDSLTPYCFLHNKKSKSG